MLARIGGSGFKTGEEERRMRRVLERVKDLYTTSHLALSLSVHAYDDIYLG